MKEKKYIRNKKTRDKISNALKGKKKTKEHIEKIKLAKQNISKKTIERMKQNHADFRGDKNPNFRNAKKRILCCTCGKKFVRFKSRIKNTQNFCSRKCQFSNIIFIKRRIKSLKKSIEEGKYETLKLDKNPNWKGGKSFEPYTIEFNNEIKNAVRKRDKYTCQECGSAQNILGYKLHIHHIDYDKKNNKLSNLISLCRLCHAQTNFKRDDWTEYFKNKINNKEGD